MQTLKKTLDLIAQNKNLAQYKVGLEKESLRCQSNLKLSPKPHPSFLGSPLHNPFFTLDFAEAQLEWTTPPKNSFKSALKVLKESQRWTMTHPSKEAVAAFWPYSMPMKLDKAPPLANFGESFEATKKKLYRKGLCHRYGHPVQSICGIHFNLSFPKELLSCSMNNTNLSRVLKSLLPVDTFTLVATTCVTDGLSLTFLAPRLSQVDNCL